MKELDLDKTVYQLTEEYPELIDILKEIGFLGVGNPVVRKTLGRKMKLPEGCKKLGKDWPKVATELEAKGFALTST